MPEPVFIDVGNVPGRKRKALSLQQGGTTRVVAYFIDDDAYERFVEATKGANRLQWEEDDHGE